MSNALHHIVELVKDGITARESAWSSSAESDGPNLCECGIAEPCNLSCIFGSEVEARMAQEPEKLAGTIPLAPGEYIANGKVWYCADKL